VNVDGFRIPILWCATPTFLYTAFVGTTSLVRFTFNVSDALLDIPHTTSPESGTHENPETKHTEHEPEHVRRLPRGIHHGCGVAILHPQMSFFLTYPVLTVVTWHVATLALAYLVIYPRYAGNNMNRLALYDLALSAVSLIVMGLIYQGENITFRLVFFDTNWFVFTLLTGFILELPLYLQHIRKANEGDSPSDERS